MAPVTGNLSVWSLDDFSNYLANSSRLGGVTEGFKEIFGMMNDLREYDQNPISYDMAYERAKKLDAIKSAAAKYMKENPKGFSSTSKDRNRIMEALGELCDKEKDLTSLDANVHYFKGKTIQDVRNGITADDFESIERAFSDLESKPMTEENVVEYINIISRYVQAAESYLHANKNNKDIGQKWDDSRTDLARMRGGGNNLHGRAQGALKDYKPFLEAARDMKNVRRLIAEGKSWEDLRELRTKYHTMTETGAHVGAGVSQRIQTEVNGTRGFFTKESIARMDMSSALQKFIDENPTRTGSLFHENKECLSQIKVNRKLGGPSEKSDYIFLELCDNWNKMQVSSESEEMKSFLRDVRFNGMHFLKAVTEDYEKKVSQSRGNEHFHPNWIKENYSAAVERFVTDPKMREQFLVNSSLIVGGIEHNLGKNHRSDASKRMASVDLHIYDFVLKQDESTLKGRNSVYAGQRLLKNEDAKKEFISLQLSTAGVFADGLVGHFDEKDRVEMTNRNVLTSRIAEMLNIGHLIAHAEPMTMVIDGVESRGCFMEFAKGIDVLNTNKYDELKELGKVNPNRLSPGLTRDAATLNLFDVICAQYDRHGANFFSILGPENEKGEREIIGLQGIDNDQAFSRNVLDEQEGIHSNGKSAGLDQIKLIDNQFADRILSITPQMLQYAAGDILSEHEIDAFMTRINTVKDYIRSDKMIRLEGDHEWDLDNYTNPTTDKEAKLKDIADGLRINPDKKISPWEATKSNITYAQSNWQNARDRMEIAAKQREREEADLQDYRKIMADKKPDDMIPKKKTEDELRAKRAAIFDQLVAGKDSKVQTSKVEGKTAETRVLTSVKELERVEKTTERVNRFASDKEATKKQERDLSFTEITADDIKEANKNVKKPIIGAHRKK